MRWIWRRRAQEWRKGLPGVLAYPADVLVKASLVDGDSTWIIDYTNSPNFGGRSISYFEDEMREVSASVMSVRACHSRVPGGQRPALDLDQPGPLMMPEQTMASQDRQ